VLILRPSDVFAGRASIEPDDLNWNFVFACPSVPSAKREGPLKVDCGP
jgi:hypothetical protein